MLLSAAGRCKWYCAPSNIGASPEEDHYSKSLTSEDGRANTITAHKKARRSIGSAILRPHRVIEVSNDAR